MSRRGGQQKIERMAVVGLAYAAAFGAVHQLSGFWSTSDFYSIWFAPAGVRFTALWLLGPRAAPLLAVAEAIALFSVGLFDQADLAKPLLLGSIVSPCLAYGLALWLSKRIRFHSSTLKPSSLRFGFVAAVAPVLAFLSSVPWHIIGHEPGFSHSPRHILAQGIVFIVGDLLGILLVAPPLLAIPDLVRDRRGPQLGTVRQWIATIALLALGALLSFAIDVAGYGIRLIPLIIAVGVVGAMFGRVAAWVAVVGAGAFVLWLTAGPAFNPSELALHLQLAGVVVMGCVAGAYADDQRRMREDLRNRDSALAHAERLKTLRAMSVAVIHELSQPLSTLSIETNYLAKLSQSPRSDPDELRSVAELIAQKTENLAAMLRRLRTFGAAGGEEPVKVEIEALVREVVAIIAPQARDAGVRIEMRLQKDLAVLGQDVELQQALTNLLRNAIVASPGQTIRVVAEASAGTVRLEVINTPNPESPYRKGMGVGKLIVEAIAEMHGGSLMEHQSDGGERTMGLVLPAAIRRKA